MQHSPKLKKAIKEIKTMLRLTIAGLCIAGLPTGWQCMNSYDKVTLYGLDAVLALFGTIGCILITVCICFCLIIILQMLFIYLFEI